MIFKSFIQHLFKKFIGIAYLKSKSETMSLVDESRPSGHLNGNTPELVTYCQLLSEENRHPL